MGNEKKDEYGEVAVSDVKDSFSNIKLMSLNDNFNYFGLGGSNETITSIINDTVQTWKKYGDISYENIASENLFTAKTMKDLKAVNDSELLVTTTGSSDGNTLQSTDAKKDFKKQDEVSVDKNTEKVDSYLQGIQQASSLKMEVIKRT